MEQPWEPLLASLTACAADFLPARDQLPVETWDDACA
jgi:hypothetical protein